MPPCLGQVKTAAHSNEITAIPALLDVLALAGRIVSIDAIGCQPGIARRIRDRGGDYVLSLKANQTRLHEEVAALFADAESHGFVGLPHTTATTVDADHGRLEQRQAWATGDLVYLSQRRRWPGLRSVLRLDATRTIGERTSRETRYFISSLPPDAAHLARIVRSHWTIEDSAPLGARRGPAARPDPHPHRACAGKPGHAPPHRPESPQTGAHREAGHQE